MNKKGFTLLELLIVVTIVTVLSIGLILLLNPKKQFDKAQDAQKSTDLDNLRKAFEDYYGDKGCYPKPSDVCFSGSYNGNPVQNLCYICGTEPGSPTLSPYLKKMPCDPTYPTKKYLYYVEGNLNCPQSFKIYTDFNTPDNQLADDVGCGNGGCGEAPNFGYDYGVTSPDTNLSVSNYFYCYTDARTCDNCLTYYNCTSNPTCITIYGTFDQCCDGKSPKPAGCP